MARKYVKTKHLDPLSSDYLESIGFGWHTDADMTPYVSNEAVLVEPDIAQKYASAANTLYEMYIEAAQYVIDHRLYHEIGIPFNLVELIELSWQNDVHWHLYGRFDFAGGIDGGDIKLIEFNADTPTALFETAIVQWALLKQNNLNEQKQFNALYEALRDNFRRIVTLRGDPSKFESLYEDWRFLFSCVGGNVEEEFTTRLLEYIAQDAGFQTDFAFIDEVEFGSDEGIFYQDHLYELWFKLIAWEEIALHEPDLAVELTALVRNQKALIFNPAYTLLFQSKGLQVILWRLFEGHPLLLETSFEPLNNKSYVQKPMFGREGESVRIIDQSGAVVEGHSGAYDNQPMVYQSYIDLPIDQKGNVYQAGVFYAYEACALGFRRGGKILDNRSKFVSHMLYGE